MATPLARLVAALLFVLLALVASLYLLRPILDPDFFWHLKTGEWIVDHRGLPQKDPFSFTLPGEVTPRERLILTAYWLSQVLLHTCHRAAGFAGIAFFRAAVFGGLLALLLSRRHGDRILYAGLLLVFAVSFLEVYPLERPQSLAFFLFAALLLLLERLTEPGAPPRPRLAWLAAPLLLAWANAHPSYILGLAVLAGSAAIEGLKLVWPRLRPIGWERYRTVLAAAGLGALASLANPNGYGAFAALRAPQLFLATNTEYVSSWTAFLQYHDQRMLLDWILMAAVLVLGVAIPKTVDLSELAILLVLGFFGLTQVRYIAFFLIAALPFLGRHLSARVPLPAARTAVVALGLACLPWLVFKELTNVATIRSGQRISEVHFPVRAAEFVDAAGLKGRMYNHFNWGGYLLWRLGPARQVFVDNRCLDEAVYFESLTVNIAYQGARSSWRSLLDARGVSYAVLPLVEPTGELLPLAEAMARDPLWVPVFVDARSVVFARVGRDNDAVIGRSTVPREQVLRALFRARRIA